MCALMATATLTSCEGTLDDIFGEWDNPASIKKGTFSYATTSKTLGINVGDYVNPITIEGDGKVTYSSSDPTIAEVDPETGVITPLKTGTVTIKATITDGVKYVYETKEISYTLKVNCPMMKWDDTIKKLVETDVEDGATAMPNESTLDDFYGGKKLPAGTYIIAEDMTFDKKIQLQGDVDIILCDGAQLTIKSITCQDPNLYELNIYGQSENSGKLIVPDGISNFKPLNVYGGQIDVTTTAGNRAISWVNGMNVYGGKITAIRHTDSNIQTVNIASGYKLAIYGGEMIVDAQNTGGNAGQCQGIEGEVEVHDGKLTVTSVMSNSSCNACAISGKLTVKGGTISLYGDGNKGQDKAVTSTIKADVTLEDSNDGSNWTDINIPADGTTSTKKYIRTKP